MQLWISCLFKVTDQFSFSILYATLNVIIGEFDSLKNLRHFSNKFRIDLVHEFIPRKWKKGIVKSRISPQKLSSNKGISIGKSFLRSTRLLLKFCKPRWKWIVDFFYDCVYSFVSKKRIYRLYILIVNIISKANFKENRNYEQRFLKIRPYNFKDWNVVIFNLYLFEYIPNLMK